MKETTDRQEPAVVRLSGHLSDIKVARLGVHVHVYLCVKVCSSVVWTENESGVRDFVDSGSANNTRCTWETVKATMRRYQHWRESENVMKLRYVMKHQTVSFRTSPSI